MSRPRRVFGGVRPGQLPATRLKILAAELSDPQRLGRARQYAADGSVLDVTIERLVATATVLGSRRDPYLVEVDVDEGFGPPGRTEVSSQCTCPDGENPLVPSNGWCKHALAALLVIADEVAIEPDVLHRWRGADDAGQGRRNDVGEDAASAGSVVSIVADPPPHRTHPLEALLESPAEATIPVIDDIEPVALTPLGDAELDKWVATAIATLTRRA